MCLYPRKIKIKRKIVRKIYDTDLGQYVIEDPPTYRSGEFITVPCGHCIECSRQISNEWAFRICDEAKKYDKNCCVTLTYNDEHLPEGGLLVKRDYQLFLKRFRKAIYPNKVRFFVSGEYGSKNARPHFHIILFGYYPPDCVYKFTRNGRDFFISDFVQSVWGYETDDNTKFKYYNKFYDVLGHILVGPLDMHTAFYTAKYLQKAIDFGKEVKPFVAMSRRPGIGGELDPNQLVTDKLVVDGRYIRLPRYYLNRFLKAGYDLDVAVIRSLRQARAKRIDSMRMADSNYFHDLALRIRRSRSLFHVFYRTNKKSFHRAIDNFS